MSEQISVRRQAVSGAKWIGISTVVTSAFQYLQVVILAWFLSPTDFGLMAMAMLVIGTLGAFTDLGISNAVIQRKDVTGDHLATLYLLVNFTGVILFAVMILLSSPVARFFDELRLIDVMIGSSLIFLVTPVGQMFQNLLQKDLQFKAMANAEISSTFIGLLASIVLGYFGFGVMALVLGQVLYYAVRSGIFLVLGLPLWKPRLHFRISDLRGYIGFGLYQVGERIVTYVSINVVNLIIGRYLGAHALGNYSVAYQLVVFPVIRASSILMTVSFPIFSKYQDNNSFLRQGYLAMAQFISFTTFPVLMFVATTAPVLIPILLGPAWAEVTPLVQILCLVGLFKSLNSTTVPTYLSKGRADIGFNWNFIVAIINAVVFFLMTRYGLVALTIAFAGISLLQFVVLQTITGNMIELTWRRYLRELTPDSLVSVVLGAAIFGSYLAGTSLKLQPIPLLVIMLGVTIVVYAALLTYLRRAYLRELWDAISPEFHNFFS